MEYVIFFKVFLVFSGIWLKYIKRYKEIIDNINNFSTRRQ